MIAKLAQKFSSAMTWLFGASWRTSLWGILAILPQFAKPVQDYLEAEKVSPAILNIVSLFFAALCVLAAKDGKVTGGTIANSSPTEKPMQEEGK
jgi:hypothetical protein